MFFYTKHHRIKRYQWSDDVLHKSC